MKLASMLLQRLSNLVDRSLRAFEKKFANEVHAADLSSYYASLGRPEQQELLRALDKTAAKHTSLEAAALLHRSGAVGSSYVASDSTLYVFSSSRAALDISLSSINIQPSTLGYVTDGDIDRPSPSKERLRRIVTQIPLQQASEILKRVSDITQVPDVALELDVSGALSGVAVLTFTTDPKFKLSREIDRSINRAVRQYIRSPEFVSDISKTDYYQTVTEHVASTVAKPLGVISSKVEPKKTVKSSNKLEAKQASAVAYKASPQLRNLRGQFSSLVTLQDIINRSLAEQIQHNMGTGARRDILNYRTGRFAESAEVTRISQGRTGLLTAFYTYMKYPYQTFEPGFKQGSPSSRNPRLLISKSIREIAATQVANRMRAVLV